jgi:3'(2'), 5'-bisphosphate nucleotidase
MMKLDQTLENELIKASLGAGDITLKYYKKDDVEVETKDNESPVTQADREAEAFILGILRRIAPDVPIVAEEEFEAGNYPDHETLTGFWLVDALDGTKSFLKGRLDYTVNIAFVNDGKPVFGFVYAPARDELFVGDVFNSQARLLTKRATVSKVIKVRDVPEQGITVVASKHHSDPDKIRDFLKGQHVKETLLAGSSMKFCSIAAGRADLYPRFGPTCEWDTAAGDAVLRAAGGMVTTLDREPFVYGKQADFKNPSFVGWGGLKYRR